MDLDLLGKRVLGRVPTGSLIWCLDTLILSLLLPGSPSILFLNPHARGMSVWEASQPGMR